MNARRKRYAAFFTAAFLGTICAFFATAMVSVLKIQGDSMAPAIESGEYVLINKSAFFYRDPQKGEIVAFPCNVYSEDGEGSILIKRVVATEGDRVEIKDGALFVNGRICDKYAATPVYMDSMEQITVKPDRIFVLSDDRSAVLDSRDQAVGQLKVSELTGKVCFK